MNAKEILAEELKRQPEDSSFDEILHNLAYKQVIAEGLEDSLAGNVIDHEEIKKRIQRW